MTMTKNKTKKQAPVKKKRGPRKVVHKPKTVRKRKFEKIEAKPLTEAQIKQFVEHYNIHKSFPGSKIPCNITGKLTTCVGPWLVKKIKQYGGPENLLRKYISRGAIKAQKEKNKAPSKKKAKRKVLSEMKIDEKNWNLPKIIFHGPVPLTDQEITAETRSACMRPNIYLDNDGHCEGCPYYNLCESRLKCLPTKRSKRNK